MKKMLVAVLLSFFAITANAQLKLATNDYTTLTSPIPMDQPNTVVEVFWFGCPHCNAIRPFVAEWKDGTMPEGVTLEYMPAVTGSTTWDMPAKSYFIMKELHLDLFDAYFDAIHVDHKYALMGDLDTIKNFFMENGVSEKEFLDTWNSSTVADDMAYASAFFNAAGIRGVPSFIVNGKYVVAGKPDSRTFDDVINGLLQMPN